MAGTNIEYPKTIIGAISAIVIGTLGVNSYIVTTAKDAVAEEASQREMADVQTQLDLTLLEMEYLLEEEEISELSPKDKKRLRYLEKRELILEERLMELGSTDQT